MNWPSIRNFPISARALIAVYTALMGSILVVALILSSWHHGLVTDKGIESKGQKSAASGPAISSTDAKSAAARPDDGQSSGVIVEPDSESTIKVKSQDWFIYENFKLGHTHLNGQSLIYFSLIVLFLMSTASEKSKIFWGFLLAASVILHTLGLFFMHKEAFGMLLRFSGGLLALCVTVMSAQIFVDTVKGSVQN